MHRGCEGIVHHQTINEQRRRKYKAPLNSSTKRRRRAPLNTNKQKGKEPLNTSMNAWSII